MYKRINIHYGINCDMWALDKDLDPAARRSTRQVYQNINIKK